MEGRTSAGPTGSFLSLRPKYYDIDAALALLEAYTFSENKSLNRSGEEESYQKTIIMTMTGLLLGKYLAVGRCRVLLASKTRSQGARCQGARSQGARSMATSCVLRGKEDKGVPVMDQAAMSSKVSSKAEREMKEAADEMARFVFCSCSCSRSYSRLHLLLLLLLLPLLLLHLLLLLLLFLLLLLLLHLLLLLLLLGMPEATNTRFLPNQSSSRPPRLL